MLYCATRRSRSPSQRRSEPNFASQTRTAFASITWKTDSTSVGELLMTCNTSDVALCCSRASTSSRVKRSSCSCIPAAEGPRPRAAVDSLGRLSFVVLQWRIFIARRSSAAPVYHQRNQCDDERTLLMEPLSQRSGSRQRPRNYITSMPRLRGAWTGGGGRERNALFCARV